MASAARPAPSAAPALPTGLRYWLLTAGVMMATIMQILDTTIANVALPHMQTSLGATLDTVTWVLTSYIVASAIAIPITGWLSDRIGQRQLFLGAIVGFIVASMLCGVATSLTEMVLFRMAQGVAAAFIGPVSQTVMLDINPPEKHGQAMSIWGMGIMVGPIAGPVLGGWLTENYDWRWVFFVNLPIGIACFALIWSLLPAKPTRRRRFDGMGYALLALGVAGLQLLLDRGQGEDWLQSGEVLVEGAVAIAGLWMVAVHLGTAREPLFPRSMFADRNFATALVLIFVVGVQMFATMALLPPMLQRLYGYPVIDTGLLLAPRGVGVFITMGIAGKLIGRVDSRILIGTGFCVSAFALHMMTGWSLEMDWRPVMWAGVVQGLGLGLVFVPLNVTAFATLDPGLRTEASALLNLLRSLGASVGISVVTTFLARNLQTSHADLAATITASSFDPVNPEVARQLGGVGDAALSMLDGIVNQQAAMIAYLDDFQLMMLVTLASLPLLLLLKAPLAKGAKPLPME